MSEESRNYRGEMDGLSEAYKQVNEIVKNPGSRVAKGMDPTDVVFATINTVSEYRDSSAVKKLFSQAIGAAPGGKLVGFQYSKVSKEIVVIGTKASITFEINPDGTLKGGKDAKATKVSAIHKFK